MILQDPEEEKRKKSVKHCVTALIVFVILLVSCLISYQAGYDDGRRELLNEVIFNEEDTKPVQTRTPGQPLPVR